MPPPRGPRGPPRPNNRSNSSNGQPLKKNGELGASAHTINEDSKIKFTRLLLSLREDATLTEIEMPTNLTNTERKFIHELAKNFGLNSKSHGKGDDRRIKISKIVAKKVVAGVHTNNPNGDENGTGDAVGDTIVPALTLHTSTVTHLSTYSQNHPPTPPLKLESYHTGSSITLNSATTTDKDVTNLLQVRRARGEARSAHSRAYARTRNWKKLSRTPCIGWEVWFEELCAHPFFPLLWPLPPLPLFTPSLRPSSLMHTSLVALVHSSLVALVHTSLVVPVHTTLWHSSLVALVHTSLVALVHTTLSGAAPPPEVRRPAPPSPPPPLQPPVPRPVVAQAPGLEEEVARLPSVLNLQEEAAVVEPPRDDC